MADSGMILIREVADAPVIMGISKPAGLKSPCREVKIMNPLFVGIDVSSKNNVAYLMKPDGSKHSGFSVQNNLGGAKILSEKIVSALDYCNRVIITSYRVTDKDNFPTGGKKGKLKMPMYRCKRERGLLLIKKASSLSLAALVKKK